MGSGGYEFRCKHFPSLKVRGGILKHGTYGGRNERGKTWGLSWRGEIGYDVVVTRRGNDIIWDIPRRAN